MGNCQQFVSVTRIIAINPGSRVQRYWAQPMPVKGLDAVGDSFIYWRLWVQVRAKITEHTYFDVDKSERRDVTEGCLHRQHPESDGGTGSLHTIPPYLFRIMR
jgi:hypothetical protein